MATVNRAARMIAVAMLFVAAIAPAAAAGRRVTVTRDMIRALGATRLYDVIASVEAWSPQSNDFYTASPTPRGLSLPRAAQWSLFLNGQPFDVSVFDAQHLEMIPVSLAEIDSVVFCDESAPGATWDAGRGRVEIFAARARGGWNAGGAASVSHETGAGGSDAGPDGSLWVSRGATNWYATLSAAMAEQPFNDPAIVASTTAAMSTLRPGATAPASDATDWFYDPASPAMLRMSASLRGGVRAGAYWQEVLFSTQNARHYFHYSEPFGREVPTDQRMTTLAFSGRAALAQDILLGYHATASETQLSDQDGVLAFDYDWGQRRASAGANVTRRGRASRSVLFASAEERRVSTEVALSRNADTILRAGLAGQRQLNHAWSAGVDAAGTFADGDGAAAVGVTADWVPRSADTLRVRVRLAQRLFVEDDNLWLWSERGYALLARNGVTYTIDGPITRTTVSSADLGWTSVGVLGGVDVDLGVRRFDDAYVEQRSFTFDSATCSFVSPTHVATGQAGNVGIVRARLWHALGQRSWADFSWTYFEEFDSDAAFSALWQTVPRHRLAYSVYGRVREAWRLRLRIAHASSTFWPDYAGIDGATCVVDGITVTYHPNVPAYTTVDAGLQYAPWNGRATLDLLARNIFDTTLRDHPAGASQAFTLALQLRVQLGAP
ncbi:MAG: hypothetical protein OEX18_15315 [Candidatus Krumholzibacteria bacterium]|nr:hypothetical protein [Candidatus Krumholzibacteria bacterium]MDH4338637.1 hypothetical protein [Candidatus Krumholzibacteria bacterium]MDH5271291.1 hypothetical protein [Candidatus Krumholzibacteria bacterium]